MQSPKWCIYRDSSWDLPFFASWFVNEVGQVMNIWKIIFWIVGTPLIPSLPACAVSWLTFCSTYRDRLSNFINESRGKKGKISQRVAVNAPFWTARKRLQMTQSALMAILFISDNWMISVYTLHIEKHFTIDFQWCFWNCFKTGLTKKRIM